jgi:hypothetical protein
MLLTYFKDLDIHSSNSVDYHNKINMFQVKQINLISFKAKED